MGECYCSECNTAADYDPEEEMEEKIKLQAERIEELEEENAILREKVVSVQHTLTTTVAGMQAQTEQMEELRATAQLVERADTISRVQAEQVEWVKHNFGDRPSWQPLLGVQEEVGELSHAFLKRHQGIRGTHEEHTADIRDAVADIIIFLMDFASSEGIDVREALEETWQKVRQRDWKKEPMTAGETK